MVETVEEMEIRINKEKKKKAIRRAETRRIIEKRVHNLETTWFGGVYGQNVLNNFTMYCNLIPGKFKKNSIPYGKLRYRDDDRNIHKLQQQIIKENLQDYIEETLEGHLPLFSFIRNMAYNSFYKNNKIKIYNSINKKVDILYVN
jgi:hypothetical protein